MMKERTFYIPVGTKKYPLIVQEKWEFDPVDWEVVHIVCDVIHLNQDYLKNDLPLLFMDIAWMIEEELDQKAEENIHVRLKHSEKVIFERNAQKEWYRSLSDFVKARCLAV